MHFDLTLADCFPGSCLLNREPFLIHYDTLFLRNFMFTSSDGNLIKIIVSTLRRVLQKFTYVALKVFDYMAFKLILKYHS